MKNFKITPKKTKTPKVEVTTLSKFQNEYSEFMKSSKSKSYIKSINLSLGC